MADNDLKSKTLIDMENKHTPAPWRYIERFNPKLNRIPFGIERTIGNAVEPIADVCNFPPATEGQLERMEANARLIAAAPELLEALEVVEKLLFMHEFTIRKSGYNITNEINKVELAIKKAKGL